MLEYDFVRIEVRGLLPPKTPAEDYRQVIEEHANAGWRLVQVFAPSTAPGAFSAYFELIFERESREL